MGWQKFSDRARESKKIRAASPEEITLWWALGNYSCEHNLDGFVAKSDLTDAWRPIGRRFNHAAVAEKCVESGLLLDHGDHYEIHDYLEYNPSKEQIEEKKKKDAKRAATYRARQNTLKKLGIRQPVTSDVTHDVTHDESCDEPRDVTGDVQRTSSERHASSRAHARASRPVPTRPVPIAERESAAADSSLSAAALVEDPERVAALRGRQRLGHLSERWNQTDHLGKWKHAFAELSRKPDADWLKAKPVLEHELQKPGTQQKLTPQHVLDYWADYVAGTPPGQPIARANGHAVSEPDPSQRPELKELR